MGGVGIRLDPDLRHILGMLTQCQVDEITWHPKRSNYGKYHNSEVGEKSNRWYKNVLSNKH